MNWRSRDLEFGLWHVRTLGFENQNRRGYASLPLECGGQMGGFFVILFFVVWFLSKKFLFWLEKVSKWSEFPRPVLCGWEGSVNTGLRSLHDSDHCSDMWSYWNWVRRENDHVIEAVNAQVSIWLFPFNLLNWTNMWHFTFWHGSYWTLRWYYPCFAEEENGTENKVWQS